MFNKALDSLAISNFFISLHFVGDLRCCFGESRLFFRAVSRIGTRCSVRRRAKGRQIARCLYFGQLRTGIRQGMSIIFLCSYNKIISEQSEGIHRIDP